MYSREADEAILSRELATAKRAACPARTLRAKESEAKARSPR